MHYLHISRSWQPYFLLWHCFIRLTEGNLHYDNILVDSDVCSSIFPRRIGIESDTAINLTMVHLGDQFFRSYKDVKCHYRFEPSSEYSGVIAIIQELSLRTMKGRCRDYIRFTTQAKESKEYCGKLKARESMNSATHTFGAQVDDVAFISEIGPIDVHIFIAKEEALRELPKINIIFTSFKYCYLNSKYHKPCLKGEDICIHENFFLDGVVNCPYYHCLDENGCKEVLVKTDSLGNKVLIASVTSLLLIFVIFILCLYICRKHGKLCWSDQFANPNNTIQSQMTRVMEMEETPNQSHNLRPTAPLPREQDDKDLPPSYESLFPQR